MLHDFINPVKTQIKRSANERARSDDLREGLKLLLGAPTGTQFSAVGLINAWFCI